MKRHIYIKIVRH